MLSFIDQEVEDLKAMFAEKEQGLVDQLTKESARKSETAERVENLEVENAQLLEAAAQHDATMARLVRAVTRCFLFLIQLLNSYNLATVLTATDCDSLQSGQLRTKEKECDAAIDRVASVEDEMRILLRVGRQTRCILRPSVLLLQLLL